MLRLQRLVGCEMSTWCGLQRRKRSYVTYEIMRVTELGARWWRVCQEAIASDSLAPTGVGGGKSSILCLQRVLGKI
jgi:hypothetical protein